MKARVQSVCGSSLPHSIPSVKVPRSISNSINDNGIDTHSALVPLLSTDEGGLVSKSVAVSTLLASVTVPYSDSLYYHVYWILCDLLRVFTQVIEKLIIQIIGRRSGPLLICNQTFVLPHHIFIYNSESVIFNNILIMGVMVVCDVCVACVWRVGCVLRMGYVWRVVCVWRTGSV